MQSGGELGGRVPTFLGVGTPKSGTTWLHRLLASHPRIAMPEHRKEIHYFDLHFDRGPDWYRRFFPDGPGPVEAVGEFTPHYLYGDAVPARIRTVPSIERFVLLVRNPVDRAFSHYRFRCRQDHLRVSFETFLEQEPNALAWGRYGLHLSRWLDEFDRDRFLVLVFEQAIADPDTTLRAVAAHLGVDPDGFRADPGERANESFVPRRGRLYGAAVRRARWLRRHDLDPLITAAGRLGLGRVLKAGAREGGDVPTLAPEVRARLWDHFEADVDVLERLVGIDLAAWRPRVDAG